MPGFNPSKDLMPTTVAACLEQQDDPMSDEEQVSIRYLDLIPSVLSVSCG